MTHDLRTEREDTPEGRISAAAYAIIDATVARYSREKCGPKLPDRADFRAGLELYIRRELVKVRIETAKKYGTFPAVMEWQKELDTINFDIAKFEAA